MLQIRGSGIRGELILSPSGMTLGGAGFVTTFVNPLARDPISISCFEWADDISTSGKLFQANYNARAIIVFGEQLTSVTFQFLELPGGATTPRRTTPASTGGPAESTSEPEPDTSTGEPGSTPSPGSTSSVGPRETETGSETTTSLPGSMSSGGPASTSQPNGQGGGGSKGLSGGAIAGIAIGVAIPVIAAIAFIAYRLGRNRQDVPIIPIHNDPTTKETGYGGTQHQDQWR
ncbi:hypothetical protein TWF281_004232 [Arthrobotrys megalospora]